MHRWQYLEANVKTLWPIIVKFKYTLNKEELQRFIVEEGNRKIGENYM